MNKSVPAVIETCNHRLALLTIRVPNLAEAEYEDSCGMISLGETLKCDSTKGLTSARGKRSILPQRVLALINIKISENKI